MPAKAKPAAADPAAMVSEDAIRQRAYYLWEADGRPEGSGEHYWGLAHAEATKAFVEATANGVAEITHGQTANTAPSAVKASKSTKAKVKEAALPKARIKAEAKPAKKATKLRAAVPKAK